ncbi:MAG: hypothetical protein J7J22_02880 [Candidatus Verstraetearchaeota archaeon]|nr:hypothetical protein [Candidatus Verstraetearchaeota archaeon]
MKKPEKIIIVIADWEEASKYVIKACKELAEEKGIEVEERKEDYEFLSKYGVKNEFGGLDIPQVFIKYVDGKIEYVMSRVPLNERGKPDIEEAKKTILKKIEGSP